MGFADETRLGPLVLRFRHRVVRRGDGSRIVVSVEADGPDARAGRPGRGRGPAGERRCARGGRSAGGAAGAAQRRLADQAGTDAMTTSQVVPALERRAWSSGCAIAATPAPCVTVTTAGRERLGGALADVEAADAEFFADVADEALVPRLGTLAGRGAAAGA
jgi:hypothetical protein